MSRLGVASYQLAQVNIARMQVPLDDPQMAEFVAALEPINALADSSSGFVWRLQTEAGDATEIRAYEDEQILFNLSVWESIDSLRQYVYSSAHVEVLKKRQQWFIPADGPSLALWWVPEGHRPTVEEAKARLTLLAELGPSAEAFTFGKHFPPPQD